MENSHHYNINNFDVYFDFSSEPIVSPAISSS